MKKLFSAASNQHSPRRDFGSNHIGLKWLGIISMIVITFLLIVAAYVVIYLLTPVALRTTPYEFTVADGATIGKLANQFAEDGVLEHPRLLKWVAHLSGQAVHIKAGSYELTGEISPFMLLRKLTAGDVSSAAITIIDGWNWVQVRSSLAANAYLVHDSAKMTDAELLKLLGSTAISPEGLFFPDTYFFSKNSSDLTVLKRAYKIMEKQINAAWENRAVSTNIKTPYELLILASIIEKETGHPNDRPLVSAVFHNRLANGYRLETDPTVIYGLGARYNGTLYLSQLHHDTPYNTYTRYGLTPTPIAMPGLAAINAAAHPAKSDALYFVAAGDGTGRSRFSRTLDQHNQAVQQYRSRRK